jgi:ribosome-binding protein aMBF1 (putative translation factor)
MMVDMATDFLQEIIAESTARDPAFPLLLAEAETRRKLARRLAALRTKKELSQAVVAERMKTSPSVVSKLESGGDVKVSTLQRYCAAIGERFSYSL